MELLLTNFRMIVVMVLRHLILIYYVLLTLFLKTSSSGNKFDAINPPVNVSNFFSYIAICAVIKDERQDDLREWVEYHHKMGIGKFYLHDNGNIPVASMFSDYMKQKIVDVKERKDIAPQLSVYHRCIRNYRKYHRWIAFIDADEFIVTKDQCSIPSVMKKYEGYGGLVLNWRMFCSSGHLTRPPGGILQNYWRCSDSTHFKSVINTDYAVSHYGNPHLFHYSHGKYSIDTDYWRVVSPYTVPRPSLYQIIYLHHYHLKSKEDYDRNRKRGRASTTDPSHKNEKYFWSTDAVCKTNCSVLTMPNKSANHCSLNTFAFIQPASFE